MRQNKRYIILLFSAAITSVILLALSFWNFGSQNGFTSFGFWPVIFLVLSLFLIVAILILYFKHTDEGKIDKLIQEKVTEERQKLLTEFEKQKEAVADIKSETDLDAAEIVPSGNFKTEESFARQLLLNLSKKLQACAGIYYAYDKKQKKFDFLTGFALTGEKTPDSFKSGENLNGQTAATGEIMIVSDIPEDYFLIESGLGKGKPGNLIIAPIVNNNKTIAVVEIANFIEADEKTVKIIEDVCSLTARKIEQIQKI